MADKINRLAPTGNMDKDSDVRYVGKNQDRQGDTVDNRNTQISGDDGASSGDATPTLGNEFAFSLGEVSAQNKRYRITVSGDAAKSHKIRFLSTKRDINILTGTGSLGELEFDGTITSLEAAFNNAVAASTTNWIDSTSGNVFEVEMTSYPYYQWYLDSTGDDDVNITCLQEAIPTDLAGPLKDIGDYDLLTDLFVHSTTQDNEPIETDLHITGIGPIGTGLNAGQLVGPLTTLTFTTDHGLSVGQWINISDSNATWLSGLFVVQAVTSSVGISIVTDTAWGAVHPTFALGAETVTINPWGIGEIGAAVKDPNTEDWTYTRLLRSVELNFVSTKAIRTDARVKGNRRIEYYTDKYNRPRSFDYKGEFITDGALNYVSSVNSYSLDNISNESLLFNSGSISFDTKIKYSGQSDEGGELSSGNKYYIYRFLDEQDAATNWSNPTRAVPVFPRSLTDDNPLIIKGGNPSDNATTKTVNLELINIPTGIYASVDIAVIESDETGSVSGTIFLNADLNEEQTTLSFKHKGNEEEQVTLDIGKLAISLNSFSSIKTVGDLTIIDKRLVAGNITYTKVENLNELTKSFKHELRYKEIDGINILAEEKIGGYLDPKNVFQYPSLVLNETYAIGCDFVFKDGAETPTFWVDTIKVDTSSINTANPTDNRRVPNGGLPHYALNSSESDGPINVPYLVFSNIDLNFLVDGIPIKNLISSIRFRFAKIEKDILASGFIIMGVSGGKTLGPVRIDTPYVINQTIKGDEEHHFQYLEWTGDYNFASTLNQNTIQTTLNGTRWVYPNAYTPQRKSAFFYSPEISMGKLDTYQLQASDSINILYPMRRSVVYTTLPQTNYNQARQMGPNNLAGTGDRMLPSLIAEMIANPTSTPSQLGLSNSNGVNQYDISDAKIMESGESKIVGNEILDTYNLENSQIGGGITGESTIAGILIGAVAGIGGIFTGGVIGNLFSGVDAGLAGSGRFQYDFETAHSKCLAIRTDTDMFPFSSSFWESEGVDYGMYYAQLERPISGKHSDIEAIEYQSYSQSYSPTHIVDINSEVDVFGGDAFITKTLLRNRFSKLDQEDNPYFDQGGIPSVADVGRHLGMSYFTQTYMNMELISKPDIETYVSFPESFEGPTTVPKLREWTDYTGGEYIQFYNSSYSYGLETQRKAAFSDELNESLGDVPTRIIFSSRDIYSSKEDSMKIFLPLNIYDFDGTFGPVEVVENISGELFVIQQRKYSQMPFNARGQLQTDINSVDILLKSGDVLSQDGKTLSTYGTEHKFSAIKGLNGSGKDVLYWLNVENGLFMRFGEDGTRVISDRGMKSFFANFSKWIKNKHEHAYEQGIRGVWDDRRKEVVWTFTAWRENSQWTYNAAPPFIQTLEGTVVRNDNAPSDTYENFPRFFKCILGHVNSAATEPAVGADWQQYWEQVEYTDHTQYSIFTICFNEETNGFRCFYGHLPKTYLKWGNTFLSSHPTQRNLIFEHRKGLPTTWYGVPNLLKPIAPKVEDAYFEMVMNELPEQSVRGVAVEYLSNNTPDRVEYRTKNQYTFDEAAQFEDRDDHFFAPIRNDATATGNPDSDDGMLKGDYLRVKFIIFGGTYNLLHSIVVKFRDTIRRINT